jgi:hypothetical protein
MTWVSAFELARELKSATSLALPGANFQDCLFPTIECDVVVFRPAGGVIAEFFFIAFLEYIEIEWDIFGELEDVLEVFVAVSFQLRERYVIWVHDP